MLVRIKRSFHKSLPVKMISLQETIFLVCIASYSSFSVNLQLRHKLSCSISSSGLNKTCSLYSIDKKKSIVATPKKEVGHHDNYMSNCSFFGSDHQV